MGKITVPLLNILVIFADIFILQQTCNYSCYGDSMQGILYLSVIRPVWGAPLITYVFNDRQMAPNGATHKE